MKLKHIEDKEKYLKKHYPFSNLPKLSEMRHCIHCSQNFLVGQFKVQLEYNYMTKKVEEYIVCPYAPECDGTVIDWFEVNEEEIDID